MPRMFCEVSDCIRQASKDGLCWGHIKARRRGNGGRTLRQNNGGPHPSQQYLSPFDRVLEAALHLADVDAMDKSQWERAKDRVRKAMLRWARTRST